MLLTTATADADRHLITVADRDSDEQIVVVNAAGTPSGQVQRIHRALEQRGMLFHLDERLEATLEGRNTLPEDLESIKNLYASADFATAVKIIDEDEKRLLTQNGGDMATQLSLLEGWRGLVAAAENKDSDAQAYLRAAIRFNPAWTIDRKIQSPKVRGMIANAHREVTETGTLRAEIDPEKSTIAIDGSDQRPSGDRMKLAVGLHLVQVIAEGRKTHSEIVEITDGKTEKLELTLKAETQLDKAAKLVDETVAAPPGARLERARALAKLTGSNRILMVEGASDDRVNVRLYDISLKKISKTFSLDGNASSAVIASNVKSAFEDSSIGGSLTEIHDGDGGDTSPPSHWYQKWYWYAGAAVLLGGIVLTYEYSSRDPSALKGF